MTWEEYVREELAYYDEHPEEDDPIEALAVAWLVYKPQLDDYLMRAQDPTAVLRRAGRLVRPNFLGLAGLGSPTD